ncbi:hypothetical protein EXS73_00890 [Candidatus Pacearchaeota archaeon]|nr:hypothetical protein [Candidatus Pacearchaeota archaeon]
MRVVWLILIGFLFFVPLVSSTLVLSPQPGAVTYLGEVLNSAPFVSSLSISQGLLSVSLICAEFRLDPYTIPVYLNRSVPARVTLLSL